MPHPSLKLGRAVVLAALVGLALAGCGRRGPLEPPPNSRNAVGLPDEEVGAAPDSFSQPAGTSPFGQPAKQNRAVQVPNKPFLLDPLL